MIEEDIYEILYRIEERIGIIGCRDEGTITGELAMLRGMMAAIPYVEVDLPITGSSFVTQHSPVLVGDSAVVNGHALITISDASGAKLVEEWRGITFEGKTGTLEESSDRYDGKTITLTYYHSALSQSKVVIIDGFITISDSTQEEDDIIIRDIVSGSKYVLSVGWNKVVSYSKVESNSVLNDIVIDVNTGFEYRIFLRDEVVSYEKI